MSWIVTLRWGAGLLMAVSLVQINDIRRTLDGLRIPKSEISFEDRLWKGWWRNLDLYPDRAAAKRQIRNYSILQVVFFVCSVIVIWSL